MQGGHGDQNSEKLLKIYKVVKQQECPLKHKNTNIQSRRYNTFDLKKKNKTF